MLTTQLPLTLLNRCAVYIYSETLSNLLIDRAGQWPGAPENAVFHTVIAIKQHNS